MGSLGPGESPIVRPRYYHMLAEDGEVWTRFLEDPPFAIHRVWYDVRVGAAVSAPAGAPESVVKVAQAVTRKRIDAVVAVDGGLLVVEVKPFGSMLAVGQALSYSRLFVAEYGFRGGVWPTVVCNVVDEDVRGLCDALGVLLISCL